VEWADRAGRAEADAAFVPVALPDFRGFPARRVTTVRVDEMAAQERFRPFKGSDQIDVKICCKQFAFGGTHHEGPRRSVL
jgi:hypothetical protein